MLYGEEAESQRVIVAMGISKDSNHFVAYNIVSFVI